MEFSEKYLYRFLKQTCSSFSNFLISKISITRPYILNDNILHMTAMKIYPISGLFRDTRSWSVIKNFITIILVLIVSYLVATYAVTHLLNSSLLSITLPEYRPTLKNPKSLSLDGFEPNNNKAFIEKRAYYVIKTPVTPIAYGAQLPLTKLLSEFNKPVWIQIDAKIISGKLYAGVLTQDNQNWLAKKDFRRNRPLFLKLDNPALAGLLIIGSSRDHGGNDAPEIEINEIKVSASEY